MSTPLMFEGTERLAATPEELWPLVADTPRVNRAGGLPAVHYSATPAEGGGSTMTAEYRILDF
ncbi:MAG: hypothetical protein CL878_10540, partial [Dehalococcoidia bacterium]|nr:hypothetical protein [Dehalococcoidia bacterium]